MDKCFSYKDELAALEHEDGLRELTPVQSREGPYVVCRGRRLLNLSSNDYLGLAVDRRLRDSFYAGLSDPTVSGDYALGSSASRLMTGTTARCTELESLIGERYGKAALVFSSGYHANVGMLAALAGKGDLILSDRLNHASIMDGMRLSGARFLRYRHRDYGHCEAILKRERAAFRRVFVVTESIFSMDGDVADLRELVRIKDRFDSFLYVDEAHAVGVRGATGLGVCEEQDVIEGIDIILGTFGKALASMGAFAVTSDVLKRFLVNRARPFIFTTALPPVVINWNLNVFARAAGLDVERRALRLLSQRFKEQLLQRGVETAGESQIVPAIAGSNGEALRMGHALMDRGYFALAVRPPTVPRNTARLRFSLCANMTWSDIEGIPDLIAGADRGDVEK